MNDCESIRGLLVLYAERELGGEESHRVSAHLSQCAACRVELDGIRAVTGWLSDAELFSPPQELSWQFLPAKLAAQALSTPRVRRWMPLYFGSQGWVLTMAASLLLACGAIWMLQHQGPAPAVPPMAAARDNAAFLARINALYARESTAEYLNQARDLMVNLLRANENCEGDNYDVSLEVARAQQLLQRKRMMEPDLSNPDVLRAKALCDEIDHLLVNLSTSQSCARPEEIRRMEHYIEREQLLLRINLLQAELSEE
jgi:hypothetical protein